MNELDLFAAAIAIADAGERASLLDKECAGRPDLRQRLEQLLAAHLQSNPLLDQAAYEQTSAYDVRGAESALYHDANEAVDAVIADKYTLVEQIGEGGMGSVWRAKQTKPVKRFVAVKLIKAGMDSKQVLARFDAERQALALMDHPNIAKVLDGGLHDQRPFFVMELVKGVPITEYCDACKLTPQQRLELFVQVCQAIQHAHQKGIIHRDIKPSNVLIALYDDKPIVKVIDFGVAKATGGALTERTIDTGFGGVVGTPQYMSPEQATLNNLDIDTRSDVYALGVLLYELLTGSPPFARKELEKRGLLEMLRVVREEEPPRPSTKLSTADALPTLSANRGTEPKKLTGLLRNELDWIVMKALEKDRTRRYETANGFAADVLRYLSGEAVQAHPPSAAYRLKKFVRRHRGRVIAASLVVLALLSGMAGTTWGLIQAKRQEMAARAAEQETRQERDRAVKAEAQTRSEADKTKAINEFLTTDLLTQAEPENNAQEDHVTLLEVLDRAADKVGERFRTQPEIEVALRSSMARTYHGLAAWEKAERQTRALVELARRPGAEPFEVFSSQSALALVLLRRGRVDTEVLDMAQSGYDGLMRLLGPDDSRVQTSMNTLAMMFSVAGKPDLAVPLFEETLRLTKAKFGANHQDSFTAVNNLAAAYEQAGQQKRSLELLEDLLVRTKAELGPDHPQTLTCLHNLGVQYLTSGKDARAVSLLEEALKLRTARLGPDHTGTLATLSNLAAAYSKLGQPAKALPMLEKSLALTQARLGNDHPDTLHVMHNLACAYRDSGQLDKAISLSQDTLRLSRATLGPDHPMTFLNMGILAEAYQESGEFDKAVELLEQTLKQTRAKFGPNHPATIKSIGSLAVAYSEAGLDAKALPLKEEAFTLSRAQLGPDHPQTLVSMSNLALSYSRSGQAQKALTLYEETVKVTREKLGAEHPSTLVSMNNLAENYRHVGQVDKALQLHEDVVRITRAKLGPDHPSTLAYMGNLALDYQAAGQQDKCMQLLEETLELKRGKLGPEHLDTLHSMTNLALAYWSIKKFDKSIALFEEAVPILERKLGRDKLETRRALGNLGVAYKDSDRLKEAIPLLEEIYRGAKNDPYLGMHLIEAYAKSGEHEKLDGVLKEQLAMARKALPQDSPQLAGALAQIGMGLMNGQRWVDAEPLLRDCLAIREKQQADSWLMFNTQSMLGGALLGQKKYADAEPLLLKGYEGMKQREKTIPPPAATRIPEALDRLIELYTATNKPDEVKKWQAERAKYPDGAPAEKK